MRNSLPGVTEYTHTYTHRINLGRHWVKNVINLLKFKRLLYREEIHYCLKVWFIYFKADFKTICGNIPGFTFDIHTGKAVGEFF